MPPGRYWIWVVPEDADGRITDHYACNTANEYWFEIVIDQFGCNPCNIPGITIIPENEPDYCVHPEPDTVNSGCDKDPPGPFLPITDDGFVWCGKSGWYELPQRICRCDANCDNVIDFGDFHPFLMAIMDLRAWQAANPNCPLGNVDVNGDGRVDVDDLNWCMPCIQWTCPCPVGRGMAQRPDIHDRGSLCRGDLNCDDWIDFGDINPFVLALSNWEEWRRRYPDCPPENADINGDGQYGGSNGFGDITPFVALLASGQGKPILCPSSDLVPDTDWYTFAIYDRPMAAMVFVYADLELRWEVYAASAGCGAPPIESHAIPRCIATSEPTGCLPVGRYWLRIVPAPHAKCGQEYALGLEEFLPCDFDSASVRP